MSMRTRILATCAVVAACAILLVDVGSAQPANGPESLQDSVGFHEPGRGRALSDSLPAVRPDLDLVELLAGVPGTFTYLFDRPGWPDGWSPFGTSPNERPLAFNGVPFAQIFTGRPAYDLIPLPFVDPPRLLPSLYGRPYGVQARLRPFVSSVPITEATYWRGGEGLQSIDVVHAQHRRRALFGRPGFLNLMGSYSGRATDVPYPGSDLQRARRVQVRLRYEQSGWSVELLNMHNRRRIGAHAGVIPQGGDFNSVYLPDLAEVEHPEAERRIVRNDLAATLRGRLARAGASTVTTYWTAETFRYRDDGDTLTAVSDRIGVHAEQPLVGFERHALSAYVDAWTERSVPRAGFTGRSMRIDRLHAVLRDTLRIGAWQGDLEAGWSNGPAAAFRLERGGSLGLLVEGSSLSAPTAAVYATGFGSLSSETDVRIGRATQVRLAVSARRGAFDATLGMFASREAAPSDVFAAGDSARVQSLGAAVDRAGAYADLGWRRDAERGVYAVLRPTVMRTLRPDASALHTRLTATYPSAFGLARVGARALLFQGDMDLDVYVEGRAWTHLSSRTLHPDTGLLLVPASDGLDLGASNVVNLVAEVQVRDATLFLTYDNVLGGTSLQAGSMVVPVYPLPARRFRLGVYWPIFG